MTPKQKRFADEYLIDINATQAAIRAGYSPKTTRQQGQRLLTKVDIQNYIKKRQKKLQERTEVTQERVVRELAKIAFADISDFIKWNNKKMILISSKKLKRDDTAAVAEITETIKTGNTNENTRKIKLHDKVKALDLLGRHLGIYTDNLNINSNVQVQIIDDIGGVDDIE